jgi:CheY-like chemotaxis protein
MQNYAILLVEDNPADADLIKEYLAEDNNFIYNVTEARTLAEALELLVRDNFDIVLLDLSLPDSSGLDTVRVLLSDYPQLVLVVLTGLKDQQIALQSVRFGAQDYLEKDQLSPMLLHRSISYAMERKKALQEKMVLFADLSRALEELEALQAILPLCGSCKRIRNDRGVWQPLEVFVKTHPRKNINHLICPDCQKELYSDLDKK